MFEFVGEVFEMGWMKDLEGCGIGWSGDGMGDWMKDLEGNICTNFAFDLNFRT